MVIATLFHNGPRRGAFKIKVFMKGMKNNSSIYVSKIESNAAFSISLIESAVIKN